MKSKWFWIAVGVTVAFVFVLMISILVAALFFADGSKLVKGSGVGRRGSGSYP
jgi:hypothetical protein